MEKNLKTIEQSGVRKGSPMEGVGREKFKRERFSYVYARHRQTTSFRFPNDGSTIPES